MRSTFIPNVEVNSEKSSTFRYRYLCVPSKPAEANRAAEQTQLVDHPTFVAVPNFNLAAQ
jgi:hypothetical protein